METQAQQTKGDANQNLKLAIAMGILKYKRLQKPNDGDPQPPCNNASESDAIVWKRKAKERKAEILRLKEDLRLAEDGIQYDAFPQSVSCKCYFFDNFGELSPKLSNDGSESNQRRFNDVLRRRFLRQVRLSERKRRRLGGLTDRSCISDYASENELEQLRASVDFLVELCETVSPLRVEEDNFKNWSHLGIDFILDTLKALSSMGMEELAVESIVSSLVTRLMRRMCNAPQDESHHSPNNVQFYVQHLMRKLGSKAYVGQRMILSVSQRISMIAESLLFMDPFDDAFPKMHNCMYIMIQLIEFLVSDNLLTWSKSEAFDLKLLEEWLTSLCHARKALELSESRNTLYILYMDRIFGDLSRQLGQVSFLQKLKPDILAKLFS
ncbi:multipolar spindle 1 [Forsythia ovata]|uniref:Multipolar spindle 1 n=1 Tax=Forsythia ovata TaxID=205694 RepID=A0ABD1R443_9LAMI